LGTAPVDVLEKINNEGMPRNSPTHLSTTNPLELFDATSILVFIPRTLRCETSTSFITGLSSPSLLPHRRTAGAIDIYGLTTFPDKIPPLHLTSLMSEQDHSNDPIPRLDEKRLLPFDSPIPRISRTSFHNPCASSLPLCALISLVLIILWFLDVRSMIG
jgi:hypothetical protein